MRFPISGVTRVLGRIREIEAMIYPNPTQPEIPPEREERFAKVLEEALDDPYGDGGFSRAETTVPAGLSERMAMWEEDLQRLCEQYEVDPSLARAVMRM
ncbi:MAG: lytic transglycosylase domain-containing protein, partial [Synergistaceae bacterium]|nr:lytic transglycosylase domain-containing protein [Synergistaceae bacterium]